MDRVYLDHFARYPRMRPQDAVKLAYQSEFGGGHMIADADRSLSRLREEWERTPQVGGPLLEPIGGGLYRLRLGALSESGLRPETANGLFLQAANVGRGTPEGLERRLEALMRLAEQGRAPFSAKDLRAYLEEYRALGRPAVSHSPEYRALYAPAYRLVPGWTAACVPLLAKIDARLREYGRARVAIDGMSGSGKSTLGARLAQVYGASLFHMDDYFLPAERKTPARLAEPGGNVDWERFLAEVASKGAEEAVVYRPFDCSKGALAAAVRVGPNPVRVVEGSYSLHPRLRAACDVRAALRLAPDEQARRILRRNGPAMQRRFLSEWIPLENFYIEQTDLWNQCDFALDTTDLDMEGEAR